MASYHVLCVLLLLLVCALDGSTGDPSDAMLQSEWTLRAMIDQVTPLMELLRSSPPIIRKRSVDPAAEEPEARAIRRRPGQQQDHQRLDRYGSEGFGEFASASGYGYGGGGGGHHQSYGCCSSKKDELLPILALVALSLLLLYLIALATTTTVAAANNNNAGGRLRRDIEMLDAPSWMSMVSEMWQQYEDPEDELACALRTLCRMNQMANETPGNSGWTVSLTSLPLSYLLHHRYQSGFASYMGASVMGWNGANCTQLYSHCPRLAYY